MGDPADQLAIRDLVSTYCDGVNQRDAALWASVWADEGATWRLRGDDIVGKDAIVALWRAAVAPYEFLVQIAPNGLVEVDGDRATGRWYILESSRLRDGTGGQLVAMYHDRYVRTDAGWRIERRELDIIFRGKDPVEGWAKPIDLH